MLSFHLFVGLPKVAFHKVLPSKLCAHFLFLISELPETSITWEAAMESLDYLMCLSQLLRETIALASHTLQLTLQYNGRHCVLLQYLVPWTGITICFCLFQAQAHGACYKHGMLQWIIRCIQKLRAMLPSLSPPQLILCNSVKVVMDFFRAQVAWRCINIGEICCPIFVLNVDKFQNWNVTTVLTVAKRNMTFRDTLEGATKEDN